MTETPFNPHQHTILIADDDPIFLKLLQAFLEKEGFRTLTAENGEQAVRIALSQRPPLILLDAHMPVLDGIDACRQIKEAFPDAAVQVLMVTASNDEGLIETAFKAGASDYITKPINWTLLKHRVNYELKMATNFQALLNSEHRFRVLFEQAPVAYAVLDTQGRILNGNPAFTQLLHAPQPKGRPLADFLHPSSRDSFLEDLQQLLDEGEIDNRIYQIEGEPPLYVQFSARLTPAVENSHFEALCVMENVTERVLNTQQLELLAATDPLTGLFNRRAFEQNALGRLYVSLQNGSPLSLILLDIDHFKKINDTFGHPVGDEVLVHLAGTLRRLLHRDTDTVYRLGGEEFAILLPDTTLDGALKVAERIRAGIEASPAHTSAGDIPFTISAGVAALTPGHIDTLDALVKAADDALYRAKSAGRNRVRAAEHL